MNRKRRFATSLSCPQCNNIASRILKSLVEQRINSGKQISERQKAPAYVELDWLGCAKENCRNYFEKSKCISRCPICKLWSLKFSLNAGIRKWNCKNRDCEWLFEY